ncbi:MAG: 50S ribosomal protein L21 [Deltaproteobacteria bacterium]|nr:50S ribosomal protein L21 [Deltaproteobacteria bacterium]|tara:strand:- start:242 stop:556 length:315 start_codon:yes stop_codon:yes gene_type:complete
MYAVIRTGGKQYRVEEGDVVKIEKIDGERGSELTFDDVLLVGNDDETHVGTPTVAGASVSGTILEQDRDKKIVVFKFRRRKNYIRKQGHRQAYTRVRINGIAAG